jgi:hypothetical protein
MASIKNLKKDINYVLGDIIGECYTLELIDPSIDKKGIDAIIDEAIVSFDGLIEKIHMKNVENNKAHFKNITLELEEVANDLLVKINKL